MQATTIIAFIGIALVCLALGAAAAYAYLRYRSRMLVDSAEHQAERILSEAETEAKERRVQARDEALELRNEIERENKKRQREMRQEESRLQRRRASLDDRFEQIGQARAQAECASECAWTSDSPTGKAGKGAAAELERVATMSQEEAKALLLKTVEQDARQDMARTIREVEAEAKVEAERRARKIVTMAVQRIASDQVSEISVSTVPLPSDDMKGRIIGRQGRNIRALENATGVDLVVDDTPEAVLLSCFDPVRREVARVALTKLILDGRIHPARIEKVVAKAQDEVNQVIREAGEQAAIDAGVPGLHPEIIRLLGRLKFRTSYGQNQLDHAVETAHLARILATELGANVQVARGRGPASRPGQGRGPRGGGSPCPDRRRPGQALWRISQGHQLHCGAPWRGRG